MVQRVAFHALSMAAAFLRPALALLLALGFSRGASAQIVRQTDEQPPQRVPLIPGRVQARPSPASDFDKVEAEIKDLQKSLEALEMRVGGTRGKALAPAPMFLSSIAETISTFQPEADRRSEAGFRAVVSMNRDGSKSERIAVVPGMIATTDPAISPDGTYLAVSAMRDIDAVREAKLFITPLTGPFKGLYRDLGFGNTPSWSPDGKKIAYMLNDGSPSNAKGGVWIMDPDGTNKEWLADGWYPRWSPDGNRIVAHDYHRNALSLIDIKTKKTTGLFPSRKWVLSYYGGSWSPDGKRVIFVGRSQSQEHLASIDVDQGESSIRILYTHEDSQQRLLGPPSYSPDGRQIVFVVQEAGGRRNSSQLWTNSYLYSFAADVPSAPRLLESKKIGSINRFATWWPDGHGIVFSSDRPFEPEPATPSPSK